MYACVERSKDMLASGELTKRSRRGFGGDLTRIIRTDVREQLTSPRRNFANDWL
jgi:hypothetical protein